MTENMHIHQAATKELAGWWPFFFLTCIAVCQFGVSSTLSASALGLLALYFVGVRGVISPSIIIYAFLVVLSYAAYSVLYEIRGEPARDLRILFVACLYLYLLTGPALRMSPSHNLVLFVVVILAGAGFFQLYSLNRGQILVVPSYMYAIKEDAALAYHGWQRSLEYGYEFNFRPSSFFSEPSYFGLILSSFFYWILNQRDFKYRSAIILILIAAVICSQSVLGVLSFVLIFAAKYMKWYMLAALFLALLAGLFIVSLIFDGSASAGGRASEILSFNDQSFLVRFYSPLNVVVDVWMTSPFGVPLSELPAVYATKGFYGFADESPFQNGFLNLFMMYGVLSPMILWLLMKPLRGLEEYLMLFIFLVQNGSFFSFDKLFLFVFFIQIVRGCSRFGGAK